MINRISYIMNCVSLSLILVFFLFISNDIYAIDTNTYYNEQECNSLLNEAKKCEQDSDCIIAI